MQVNIKKPEQGGKTIVAQNITKVSERVDVHGNVIDPKTKQIIKLATE